MTAFTEWLAALTDDDLIMLDHAIKHAYGRKDQEARKRSLIDLAALSQNLEPLGIRKGHLFILGAEYAEWYSDIQGDDRPYQGAFKVVGADTVDGVIYIYFDGGRLPYDVFLKCKPYEPYHS